MESFILNSTRIHTSLIGKLKSNAILPQSLYAIK
jgi:hypothetical protein